MSERMSCPMRWLFGFAICVPLWSACEVEGRQATHNSIFALRPVPESRMLETAPGAKVRVGVQALDQKKDGVNKAPVVFFLATDDDLTFEDTGPEVRTTRVTTGEGSISGVELDGLASVSIKASEMITEQKKMRVFGALADDLSDGAKENTDASVPDPSRFDVLEFEVTVTPAMEAQP